MSTPASTIASTSDPKKKASPKVLLRLFLLARPEWKLLGLATVFLFVGSAASLSFPQFIKQLIDGALTSGDKSRIDQAAFVMACIFAVQGLAMALRYVLFSQVGERVVTRLRTDVYKSLLAQEIAFFDQRRTGELTSRLSSDTTVLQSAVSANVSMVLRNAVQALGGAILLVWTSPTLALLMLTVVPPVAIGAVTVGRKVRALAKQTQDALALANEVAEESLSGIRTVRQFAAEESEGARYSKAMQHAYEVARKRFVAGAWFMGPASFAAFGSAALVLWYGGRLVLEKAMTVGELTSFLVYSMFVAFALGALGDLWADFMKAAGAAERIFELLDRVPLIPLRGGARPERVEAAIRFDSVAFSYPTRADVPVLRGMSFDVKPGEVVALVGHSGAGKSTIAQLITRLYDPQSGAITFGGYDLTTLDPEWLRRKVGVVSQEPILFSTTIAENIRYGRPGATDAEVEAAARAANAHGFIEKFPDSYKTQVGERGIQLSGGQKQRVAIARAVLKDPRLLILDEATSALDAESEHLVKDALDRLMRDRTTIVIAHRLSTVRDADRVLVVDEGVIAQAGSHDALVAVDGIYRKLVERQFAYAEGA